MIGQLESILSATDELSTSILSLAILFTLSWENLISVRPSYLIILYGVLLGFTKGSSTILSENSEMKNIIENKEMIEGTLSLLNLILSKSYYKNSEGLCFVLFMVSILIFGILDLTALALGLTYASAIETSLYLTSLFLLSLMILIVRAISHLYVTIFATLRLTEDSSYDTSNLEKLPFADKFLEKFED